MKILKIIVLLLNALVCVKFTHEETGRKTMKIDRCMQCPGYTNLTFTIDKMNLRHIGKIYSVSLKYTVLKTTSKQLKIRAEMMRCKSREALDTCEPMPDMVFSTLCMVVNLKLPPFGDVINAMHPSVKCPIEKETYTLNNYTLDEVALSIIPLEGWYWKAHSYLYDKMDGVEKLIMCMYMEFSVSNV